MDTRPDLTETKDRTVYETEPPQQSSYLNGEQLIRCFSVMINGRYERVTTIAEGTEGNAWDRLDTDQRALIERMMLACSEKAFSAGREPERPDFADLEVRLLASMTPEAVARLQHYIDGEISSGKRNFHKLLVLDAPETLAGVRARAAAAEEALVEMIGSLLDRAEFMGETASCNRCSVGDECSNHAQPANAYLRQLAVKNGSIKWARENVLNTLDYGDHIAGERR